MRRRHLLELCVGSGALFIAGCIGDDEEFAGIPADLRDDCPTTLDLDVDWPDELTTEHVSTFVEAYEEAYLLEEVIEWEPSTSLDSLSISASVDRQSITADDGYEVPVSGGGAAYTPNLDLTATVVEAPADATPVPVDDLELELAVDVASGAAAGEDGEATDKLPHSSAIDEHLAHLDDLSPDFDPPTSRDERGTLFVEVDDVVVELEVSPDDFHGDYWFAARYYVDEQVVMRAAGEETDPMDGDLLECRSD